MKNFLQFMFLMCVVTQAWSQPLEITGRVVSGDDQQGLPGVNVVVEGTATGTVTDMNGNYRISAPGDAVLIFSSVGYISERINVQNRSVINFTLLPDITTLDEMVVIGYGEKKKRDIIGSVATISSEDITRMPMTSFENALQGLAAGVSVVQSSGVPGAPVSIKVRGLSSINSSTDPLWVIDGMPVYSGGGLERTQGSTGQSPLSMLNPNDIESIEVLKDASATAIYGSRGSNGVVLVTTKSGRGSKGVTNVTFNSGLSDLARGPADIGFTNTREWFDLVEEARRNSSKRPNNPDGVFSPFEPRTITAFFRDNPTYELTRNEALAVNTNWFDEILRTGNYQDLNLSSSKGFDGGSFFISAGYRDDKSVLKNNRFQRFSGRANLNFEPVKGFEVGARLNFSYTKNDRQKTQTGGATGSNSGGSVGGFGQANRGALPWFPVFNSDHRSGYWNPMSGSNLTANIDRDLMLDVVDQYRGIGGVYFNYAIPSVKGLSVRSEVSIDFIQNNSVFWIADILREMGSYATDRAATRSSSNYNIYATYNRNFGEDHNILIVAGTESQSINQYTRDLEGQNLTGSYQQLGVPQDFLSMSSRLNVEEYLRAFFGRADYKFKDRYLIGTSFRRDASSNFAPEFRWGTFTALSAGWIISEEAFFNIPKVTMLKLRGSFGQTGNKDIPPNLAQNIYENRPAWRYGTQDLIAAGTRLTNIGTPDITWETTNSYDVGFDFALMDNRISGSIAYYMQNVTDMLLRSQLPNSAGVQGGGIWSNIGDMNNFGFEFEIKSVNIHKNNFKWTTDFNFTTNNSKILSLTPDIDRSGRGIISGFNINRKEGRLRPYFMAEDAGIDPERGINMIWEIDFNHYIATGETIKTGRKVPATLTNLQRNRIIHNDKSAIPRFFGGINNTWEYKGFDLNVLISFSGGNWLYDYEMQRGTNVQIGQVVLRKDLMGNTWTPDNPNAKYPELRWNSLHDWGWNHEIPNPGWTGDPNDPRAFGYWTGGELGAGLGNYNNETENWTKYLFRGDFVRVRNIQLGYTFPKELARRMKVSNIRTFISGNNLFTFTPEYEGWDPETGGVNLPLLKMYNVGITVQF
ncbi:MAG: SusC/RagA family TonB-linked outer membrane protein [Cyclobacteriaceae bacterium]|nr:SusC/RagA family TonB-linked outer membrane protein [Cyclobacteriaceae bacterium]